MNLSTASYKSAIEYSHLQKDSLWIRKSSSPAGTKGEIIKIRYLTNHNNYFEIDFNTNKSRYNATFFDNFIPYKGRKKETEQDQEWLDKIKRS